MYPSWSVHSRSLPLATSGWRLGGWGWWWRLVGWVVGGGGGGWGWEVGVEVTSHQTNYWQNDSIVKVMIPSYQFRNFSWKTTIFISCKGVVVVNIFNLLTWFNNCYNSRKLQTVTVEDNVCTPVTNCFSAHETVISVFIDKHQNNTWVSTETVRHESTSIILFLIRYDESTNDDKTIFTHRPRVSLALLSFWWWQWPDNCDAITWIVIFNSLNIDFIHDDIHGQSCKKIWLQQTLWGP